MSADYVSLTPNITHLSNVESKNAAKTASSEHESINKINNFSVEIILTGDCKKCSDSIVHSTSIRPGGVPGTATSEGHTDSCLSSVLDDKNVEGNKDVKGNFDLPELHLNKSENLVDEKTLEEAKHLIENELDSQLEIFLKNLDNKSASNVVIYLLNRYAKDDKGSDKYDRVIQATLKAFPNVGKLFDTSIAGRTLSVKGMELIFQNLTEKGALQMDALTATGILELKTLLEQLPDMPDGKYGVAFCLLPPHFTPILFDKIDGHINVIMTDSLGKTSNVQMLSQFIKTEMKDANLFVYTQQRQITHTNCRIFTIRDLVHMSKNTDFTNFVKENVSGEANGIKFFDKLPAEMLKVTQTRQFLTENDKESQILSKNPTKKTETLAKALERHSVEVERVKDGKVVKNKFNLLIENRFKKYEKIIIAKTISEGIEKET